MTTGMEKARQLIQENLEKQEKFLDLGNLGLTELPEELWELEHLEGLNLGTGYFSARQYHPSVNRGPSNKIGFISPDIMALTNLLSLSIASNLVENISTLSNLKQLSSLDLNSNLIKSFPIFLLDNRSLRSLRLFNNPITNFPTELLGNSIYHDCLNDASAWFADLEKGAIENFELKLILVGNGRVGKSSIVDALTGEEFNPEKQSTHAIQIDAWRPKGKRNPLKVDIWDFGGQEIYHGMHRLFLQTHALFLVVWDLENEQTTEIALETENGIQRFNNFKIQYWLDYVQAMSKDSPIIIVQNKTDLHEEHSITQYIGTNYNYNIHFFRAVSAKQGGSSIVYLRETILAVLTSMSEYGQNIPWSWDQVRNQLIDIAGWRKYLSYEEYLTICKEFNIIKTAPSLINFLHQTGVLYYKENLFENHLIVNQSWAIHAVYSLLEWQKVQFRYIELGRGWFNRRSLEVIWEHYTEEERRLILSFMVNSELCFKVNESEENLQFVIPQLLPDKPDSYIEDFWEDRYRNSLYFIYQIPNLHQTFIHRFITRAGRLAEPRGLWRRGISIKYNRTYALIEVSESSGISIWVKGPQQLDLLGRIRNTFQELLESYDQVESLIGAKGSSLVNLAEAEKYQNQEVVAALDGTFVKMELLRPFFSTDEVIKLEEIVPPAPKRRAARLYLSWSGENKDKTLRDEFVSHLSLFKHRGWLEVWDLENIQAGGDRQKAIKDAQNQADIFAILISPAYFGSGHGYKEMQAILNKSKQNTDPFIPILCRPFDLSHSALDGHQLLPRDGIAITVQPNSDAAWKDIIQEIGIVLRGLGW